MVYRGETVRIEATLLDYDGSALTPDSQSVILYDPGGTQSGSTNTSPTLSDTGIYYTDWDIASDAELGHWKVVWSVTENSKVGIGVRRFTVEAL